jgi:16S rRNA processing protein RimM
MNPQEWELVGVLTKTQGKDGELLLKVKKDFPPDFRAEDPVFIPVERKDEALPFYMNRCERVRRSQYAVRFDLIDDENRASRMLGLGVWLPRSAFPENEEEERLLDRLQGYRVIDREQGDLGIIQGGVERSEQPIAHVGPEQIPVPLTEALIASIDQEGKLLYMDLPEGLNDL